MKPTTCKYKDITKLTELEEQKITIINGEKTVQCCMCQKILPYNSEEYFNIAGNLMIGMHGGLIGNNFKNIRPDRYSELSCELGNVDILCIKCFLNTILKVTPQGQLAERIKRYLT